MKQNRKMREIKENEGRKEGRKEGREKDKVMKEKR